MAYYMIMGTPMRFGDEVLYEGDIVSDQDYADRNFHKLVREGHLVPVAPQSSSAD